MHITRDLPRYAPHVLGPFWLDGVAASLTDAQLPLAPGDALPDYWPDGIVAPFDGQITAISARLSSAASAGSLTIGPTINGTEKSTLTQTVTTATSARGRVARDSVQFVAGDVIGVEVTTSGSWNGTTVGLVVMVWTILTVEAI